MAIVLEHSSALVGLPVLVVDDDRTSAAMLTDGLRREGCQVRSAGSAEEALGVLAAFRPRALVLELVLPFMSGLVLARRLKADPATHDIVILAIAEVIDSEAEAIMREVGCAACVKKPLDPIALFTLLGNHVARSTGGQS